MDTSRNKVESFLLIVSALALVITGCLPAPGADNAFYVLVPYAAAMIGFVLCLAARHDITFRHLPPEGIPETVRNERLQRRSLVATVAAFACAVGESVHIIFFGSGAGFGFGTEASLGSTIFGIGYVLLMLLVGVCMGRFRHGIGSE